MFSYDYHLNPSEFSVMYSTRQQSFANMFSFDHDYTSIYSSEEMSLHTNQCNDPQFFNTTNYDADSYSSVDEITFSPNYETRPIQNFNDFHIVNPASCFEEQCLKGSTNNIFCLSSDRHERRHGKLNHERLQTTIKKRKPRTIFNTQQILTLEKIFKNRPYVSREERKLLMEMLNVSERVIKVWFQNRRRLSGGNQRDYEPTNKYYSSTLNENSTVNLSYVESKIKDADEFGFVTLDERAMNDLITVVDSLLRDVDLSKPLIESNDSPVSVEYEPISPVSSTDGEEEGLSMHQWEPKEPEVSLRHLFDVQALMSL